MSRRLQLFEFVDQAWLPTSIRDGSLEVLTLAFERVGSYNGLAPALARFLAKTGAKKLLDLGSGAGGPARALLAALRKTGGPAPRLRLSDLYPNLGALQALAADDSHIDFCAEPIDATAVPETYADWPRLACTSFHHFPPPLAQAILDDAVRSAPGIFIVEPFPRNPLRLLPHLLRSPHCYFLAPWLSRERRPAKLVFTYLLPLILGVLAWDGLVSTLRVYTRDELMAMAAQTGAHDFDWEYGTAPFFPGGMVTWFAGVRRT